MINEIEAVVKITGIPADPGYFILWKKDYFYPTQSLLNYGKGENTS